MTMIAPDLGGPGHAAPAAGRWADAAALGMVVAGACHLLAALEHLTHDVRFAVFFLAAGVVQVCLGPGLRRRPRPAVVAAALAGTVGLLLLYLLSRTVALELGPHADRPEDPDPLGTVVVVAELLTVAALPALLPPRGRALALNAVLAVGVAVWLAWFAGIIG